MELSNYLGNWLRTRFTVSDGMPRADWLPTLPGDGELRDAIGGRPGERSPHERALLLITISRDGRPHQRAAALQALAAAPPGWLTRLDTSLRDRWWAAPRWSQELAAAVADDTADLIGLVVAAGHHSGMLRQAAVLRLAEQEHPVAVAMLALRTTDWVPQVHDAARAGCDRLLTGTATGAQLVALCELAADLRARSRARWLRERVERLLPELPADALRELLAIRHPRVRRAVHRATIAAGRLSLDELVDAALRERDVATRVLCANAALAATPDLSVARRLLAARTPLIRSEAVRLLARDGDLAVADAALADRHALVRLVAQVAVSRAGGDPAARYRQLLAGPSPEPSAIAGLGETGVSADAGLIRRWLSHPAPRGRQAAVRALRAVDAVRAEDLAPLLDDPSPAVVRQAETALEPVAYQVDPALLVSLLATGRHAATRVAAWRLVSARNPWQGLAVSLRALAQQDPVLGTRAAAEVSSWPRDLGRSAERKLTPDVVAELAAAIESARPVIGDRQADLLRFCARLGDRG